MDSIDGLQVRQLGRRRLLKGARVMMAALLLWAAAAGIRAHAQTGAGAPVAPQSVQFTFGGNAAQIPATFLDHLLLFPASVNGSRPLLFEVDSTTATSSIDPGRAAELGLGDVSPAKLHLSGVDVMLPDFTQASKEGFAALVGRTYEGTLGKDFLDEFVVEVDYGRQTAQLYDPEAFQYTGKGKAFPLRFAGSMPVVQAKCTLGGKTFEADFAVNTALDAPVRISPRFASAHRLGHMHTLPDTDDPMDEKAVAVRLKSFQIGPYTVDSPMGEIAESALPAGDAKLAGEIGGGMLRRFTVIFDYPRQQMILEPGNKFPDDDSEDMSGISMIARGPGLKTFDVVRVEPGTPGADAKIQKGDVIAGVDTDPAADLTLFELRDLFRQVGHSYKLLVERNEQEIPVTVKMRRLL